MARDQTVFSELAVAIALNGGIPQGLINVTMSYCHYKKEYDKRKPHKKWKQISSLESAGNNYS